MEVILTVHLPYESLREWGNVRRVSLVESCSYVQILNEFMYEKTGFKVKDKCQRVEKRLEKACSEVRMKFAGKNGTTYRNLCQKEVKLALMERHQGIKKFTGQDIYIKYYIYIYFNTAFSRA